MNSDPPSRWSPMVSGPEDFADFLEFADFNFATAEDFPQTDVQLNQNGAGTMDTSMEGMAGVLGLEQGHLLQQMDQRSQPSSMNGFHLSTELFPDLSMQSELFDERQQHQLPLQNGRYHGQHAVPPTPNSIEMHGAHPQYYRGPTDHPQLHLYDRYRRSQEDQVGSTLWEANKEPSAKSVYRWSLHLSCPPPSPLLIRNSTMQTMVRRQILSAR